MNVGPLGGVLGSAAGSQLQQTRGKDTDRASHDVGNQQRADKLGDRAEAAAGIGQTEEDQGTAERDADGRKMWERSPDGDAQQQQPEGEVTDQQSRNAKDPSGAAGNALDLTG
ncbi:MAG: hypothetical protein MI757_12710 [Pirellulales bacterium]|nr:hypothetical protein [Pirellulales bacterium]